MAKIYGLDQADYLNDAATDILEPKKEKPIQVAKLTDTGDTTPLKVVQAAPPKQTTSSDAVADRVRKKAEAERQLKELEEQEKKAKAAATKAQQAKVYAQYEPQLTAPAPKYEAPKETFTQLAGLGAMMMMMGAMAGGKTYGSAIGAMNGLAGMFKGYQEGRKEAYDRSKTEFEQSLKQWKENKAQVKEAFARALKLGSKDLSKASSDVVAELTARGETTVAELVKKHGVANVAQAFNQASDNADRHFDAVQSAVARMGVPAGAGERVSLAGPPPTPDTPEKPKTRAEQIKALKKQLEDYELEETISKAQEDELKGGTVDIINPETGRTEKMLSREYQRLRSQGKPPMLASEARFKTTSDETLDAAAEGIASYSQAPPGRNNRQREEIMRRVRQINPNYRESDYGDRSLAYRNWTQPNGFGAKQLAAFNTVAQHLDTLDALGKALENGDIPAANAIVNRVRTAFGDPRVTNFDTAKLAVSGELVKAVTGVAGALKDREEAAARLLASAAPAQMSGAIETWKDLIAGRLETSLYQFKTGTGRTDQDFLAILPPRVRDKVIDYIGVSTKGGGSQKPEITSLDQLQKAIQDGSVTREEAETIYNRLQGQ